jgi:hypothetical protein
VKPDQTNPPDTRPVAEPAAEGEWPFRELELEEIDPPILPWRKRKPVEKRSPARKVERNQAG